MLDDSDLLRVVDPSGKPVEPQEPAKKKRHTRTVRLILTGLLAFIAVAAVMTFTPARDITRSRLAAAASSICRLIRNRVTGQVQNPKPQAENPGPKPPAQPSTDPALVPTVQAAWQQLDLSALPTDVVPDLESGKYYYDRRFPGNFGLAIRYWQEALAGAEASDSSHGVVGHDPDRVGLGSCPLTSNVVRSLVAAAEKELAQQFSTDSGDAVVLLKQHKKDQAVSLLEEMRADYLDITAPQYVWASVMLDRQNR